MFTPYRFARRTAKSRPFSVVDHVRHIAPRPPTAKATHPHPLITRSALQQLLNERVGHVGSYPRVTIHQRAIVQDRLGTVQGENVGALEEYSDGDLITPEQRLFHSSQPVGGIVSRVILELLHARTEPLISIIVIIGDTRAEDIQERETLVLYALFDQLCEVLLLATEAARDEGGPGGQGERNGVHWRFDVTEGHAFRFHADPAGGRGLASREAVDLIVHDDVEQIDVAAHGVDKVVAADTETVAVTASHQYCQIVIGKLHPSRHRQRPAVQSVHAIGINETGKVGRTADATDGDHVMVRDLQLHEGFLYRSKHTEIAAARAPIRIDFAFQIGNRQ